MTARPGKLGPVRPNPHAEYERRKEEWARANPDATPRQYEQAIARIARECGV